MAEIKRVYRQTMPAVKLADATGKRIKKTVYLQTSGVSGFKMTCLHRFNCPMRGRSHLRIAMPTQAYAAAKKGSRFSIGSVCSCRWMPQYRLDMTVLYQMRVILRLEEEGFAWKADKDGVMWCFERYSCPRFTTPDEEGNVILDMCFYVK